MRRSVLVATALAATLLPAGLVNPASADPPDRPTIKVEGVKLDGGKIVVVGAYSCAPESEKVDELEVHALQYGEEEDVWHDGFAVIEAGVACDGEQHEFEAELTAEGDYIAGAPIEVDATVNTVKHQFAHNGGVFTP